MPIAVIMGTVYRVTKSQLKEINRKSSKIETKVGHYGTSYSGESDFNNWIEQETKKYKKIGEINFDCSR